MKDQFVTFEIATKLKELGFDEKCMAIYFQKEFRFIGINSLKETNSQVNNIDIVDAPLWQQCIDWLENTHKLVISTVFEGPWDISNFSYEIYLPNNHIVASLDTSKFNARKQAILKTIELIQKK